MTFMTGDAEDLSPGAENAGAEPEKNGRIDATAPPGSRAGYIAAREALLHSSTMLLDERCLVRNDISGWGANPWWVRVTMRDGEISENAQKIVRSMRDTATDTSMADNGDGTVSVTFYYECTEEEL